MKSVRITSTFLVLSVLFFTQSTQAQFPHGPYLGLEVKAGVPLSKPFSEVHAPGFGGRGTFGMQVADNSFITLSGEAMTYGQKSGRKDPNFKAKNIFTLQSGFRYNFWNAESEKIGAFFVEPRIGYSLVGKNFSTLSIAPVIGYTMKGQLDFFVWLDKTTSSASPAKLTSAGIGIAYNIFFSGSDD